MTAAQQLLEDLARRPADTARLVLDGLGLQEAHTQPDGTHNSIVWLIWHAARQEDLQVAQLSGREQVWSAGRWGQRLGIDRGAEDFGFGDSAQDVGAVTTSSLEQLAAYLTAVTEESARYAASLSDDELTEVIDDSYDPPVTRGVRLISTFEDASTHVGQAAYARSLVESGWTIGF